MKFSAELLTPITAQQALRLVANDSYGMQPKFDGVRYSIDLSAGGMNLAYNKLGQTKPLDRAIAAELAAVGITDIYADGELEGGVFVIFDILRYGDHDLSDYGYRHRWAMVEELGKAVNPKVIKASPLWQGTMNKHDHYTQERTTNAEGVVFKKLDAPYRGGRNGNHFKMKFVATATVRVGKKEPKDEAKCSIALEMNHNGKWIRVGHASMIGKGTVPAVGSYVECRYLYAVKTAERGGDKIGLIQTMYLMTRDDVTDMDCQTTQLKYRRTPGKVK